MIWSVFLFYFWVLRQSTDPVKKTKKCSPLRNYYLCVWYALFCYFSSLFSYHTWHTGAAGWKDKIRFVCRGCRENIWRKVNPTSVQCPACRKQRFTLISKFCGDFCPTRSVSLYEHVLQVTVRVTLPVCAFLYRQYSKVVVASPSNPQPCVTPFLNSVTTFSVLFTMTICIYSNWPHLWWFSILYVVICNVLQQ